MHQYKCMLSYLCCVDWMECDVDEMGYMLVVWDEWKDRLCVMECLLIGKNNPKKLPTMPPSIISLNCSIRIESKSTTHNSTFKLNCCSFVDCRSTVCGRNEWTMESVQIKKKCSNIFHVGNWLKVSSRK